MSAGTAEPEQSAAMPAPTQIVEGNVLPCSFYGCKQTFANVQKLTVHIESHQIPTESLPGKVFQCSSLGCGGSFPNMQQLMEHMRCHYKPNHYFLCESCRAKLRSHRALIKHLHTCSKVAKSKVAKVEEMGPPQPIHMAEGTESAPDTALLPAEPPEPLGARQGSTEDMQVEPGPLALPGASIPYSGATVAPHLPDLQASIGGLPPDADVVPASGTFSILEPSAYSQQPLGFPTQPQPDGSPVPFPTYQTPIHTSPSPSYGQLQQQQRLLRTVGPTPPGPPAPPASPGSNAVWRKNQDEPGPILHRRDSPPSSQSINTGQSFSSRILWEHTRGRYRCLQCGHSTPTRQEMTAHIEGHHKGPASRLQGDVDFRMVPPFQPKSSPDGEPSVYTQL